MRKIRFPLIKPYSDSEELKGVARVLKSGWLTQGRCVNMVEDKIKKYCNAKFAFLVNSATSGLVAAINALKLDKNDEVIVPSFSFPATANAVFLCGKKVVFCDIDPATFNIDPGKIEPLITKRTKAILLVHEFGLMAEMDKILKIAKKYNLAVIEDAACAFGSEFRHKKAGSFGDIGVFSFHPRKVITCGEGGCVITGSKDLAASIKAIRNHGELDGKFIEAGFNFRLSDIQGAILSAQFNRIEKMIAKRISLALRYNCLLRPLEERGFLRAPQAAKGYRHIYQSYVITLFRNINRYELRNRLKESGIETQIGTYCIPQLDFYRKNVRTKANSFKNASLAYKNSLTLPLYHDLKEKEQEFIIGRLTEVLRKCAA